MTETNRIEFKRELTDDLDIEKEVVAFLNYHEGGIFSKNVTDNVTDTLSLNQNNNLTNRQLQIVEAMQSDIRVSTTELAAMFSVTQRTIKRDIDCMKKINILKRVGNEKSGYWLILI